MAVDQRVCAERGLLVSRCGIVMELNELRSGLVSRPPFRRALPRRA